jgi:DNA-binding beta-propeller fold protein YncE
MKQISIALLFAAGLCAQVPEIAFDSTPNLLKLPAGQNLGEVPGVATDSKGHIIVLTRTGDMYATTGSSRTFTHGGVQLLEFDSNGRFLKEMGQGLYGFLYAQQVRVDPQDNIWVVDRGSSLVIKFDPNGNVIWPMGRKPEAINVGLRPPAAPPAGAPAAGGRGGRGGGAPDAAPAGGRGRGLPGVGTPGDLFNQPSDVAWNSDGEIYVADGYGNARIGKYDKMGHYIKAWGHKGSGEGEFSEAAGIQVDANNNVYVADASNKRIQIFDKEGAYKTSITGIGSPRAICISPGAHQFLYASNSNGVDDFDNGEIYKLELDGKILGKFGEAGKQIKQFSVVNAIDCRRPNELYIGEIGNWRVQKITLKP